MLVCGKIYYSYAENPEVRGKSVGSPGEVIFSIRKLLVVSPNSRQGRAFWMSLTTLSLVFPGSGSASFLFLCLLSLGMRLEFEFLSDRNIYISTYRISKECPKIYAIMESALQRQLPTSHSVLGRLAFFCPMTSKVCCGFGTLGRLGKIMEQSRNN
jgi:hypothetical protein